MKPSSSLQPKRMQSLIKNGKLSNHHLQQSPRKISIRHPPLPSAFKKKVQTTKLTL